MLGFHTRSHGRTGKVAGLIFFGLFFVLGEVLLFFLFVRPYWRSQEARGWIETPCAIRASELVECSDGDGTTYRLKVVYTYSVNGQDMESDRFHFLGGSSSSAGWRRRMLERYPAGSETVCYVNPANPAEAVLYRDWVPDYWFGLIPLLFSLVGIAGLIALLRRPRAPKPAPSNVLGPTIAPPSAAPAGAGSPIRWRARQSPLRTFILVTVFALFWNGILSVFLIQVISQWRHGSPSWFLMLFLLPFVAVGLGMAAAMVYTFLALFNPRLEIEGGSAAVPLGGRLRFRWRVSGALDRLEHLELDLEGSEHATYRRGTDTVTDHQVFHRQAVARIEDVAQMRGGEAAVDIPADSMHTLAADHNRIRWEIKAHGAIRRWPDLQSRFEFPVAPPAPARTPAPALPTVRTSDDSRTDTAARAANAPTLQIRFRDDRALYAPGEVLAVGVLWELASPPRAWLVRLVYFTRGKGTPDEVLVAEQRLDNPGPQGIAKVEFGLPAGPLSFSGTLISLVWAVEVLGDRSKLSQRVEFVLAIQEREIRLPALLAAPGKKTLFQFEQA